MRTAQLDARLSAIAGLVPPCGSAADIGADHGYLGAHLLLVGRCDFVRFVDISQESLEKARRLIGKLRLTDRAAFLVGDGAEALNAPVDVAVMAGMGAELICGIIARGRAKLQEAQLVLSPNLDAPMVRRFLMESGYEITDEAMIADGRRFYPVIAARPGAAHYGRLQILAGPVLLQKRPDSLMAYADHCIRVIEKALPGARRGGEPWVDDMSEELELWREVRHGSSLQNARIGGGDCAL
jgi:tRNA (adenine22-N1)-methyltransferase